MQTIQTMRCQPAARGVPSRWSGLVWSAAMLVGAAAATLLATRIVQGELPYPHCGFKIITGLPCPGCGATRSLSAVAAGDIVAAGYLNPFVSAACGVVVAALPLAAIDAVLLRGRIGHRVGAALANRTFVRAIAVAVVVNWIWLIVAGR